MRHAYFNDPNYMSNPFDTADFRPMTLTDHGLKKALNQFTCFADATQWLLGPNGSGAILAELIENTGRSVQERGSWDGQLLRDVPKEVVHPEDRWERSLWRMWRPSEKCMPATEFHPLSPRILTYQFPLAGEEDSAGWGEIDLVGVSPEGTPVVIEVKAEKSQDSPVAVVMEAVRYGVALREFWKRGVLRKEWCDALGVVGLAPKQPLPNDLRPLNLLCAAPDAYWKQRDRRHSIGKHGWPLFQELCRKLKEFHGLSVEFVKLEFSATSLDTDGES